MVKYAYFLFVTTLGQRGETTLDGILLINLMVFCIRPTDWGGLVSYLLRLMPCICNACASTWSKNLSGCYLQITHVQTIMRVMRGLNGTVGVDTFFFLFFAGSYMNYFFGCIGNCTWFCWGDGREQMGGGSRLSVRRWSAAYVPTQSGFCRFLVIG